MKRFSLALFCLLAAFNLGCSEYLIITHDDFYESVLPLKAHKEAEGLVVKVVRTSEIAIDPTAEQIADYIRAEYDATTGSASTNLSLRYVLLVGDVEYVPTFYRSYPDWGGSDTPIATDLYYATMDSDSYLPNISVGRLPVDSVGAANVVVSKIVDYVPETRKVLLFGGSPEILHASSDGSILESAGFTVDVLADAEAESQTIDRLNQGRVLAAYYGHGWLQGMSSGELSLGTLSGLTNTRLPVILSGGCKNAWFDDPDYDSLAELLLEKPDGGAIAFVGSTRSGGYGYRYEFVDGFFEEYTRSGVLGRMLNAGRRAAYDAALADGQDVSAGSWTHRFVAKITLLGDPALDIWSEFPDPIPVPPEDLSLYEPIPDGEPLRATDDLAPTAAGRFGPPTGGDPYLSTNSVDTGVRSDTFRAGGPGGGGSLDSLEAARSGAPPR